MVLFFFFFVAFRRAWLWIHLKAQPCWFLHNLSLKKKKKKLVRPCRLMRWGRPQLQNNPPVRACGCDIVMLTLIEFMIAMCQHPGTVLAVTSPLIAATCKYARRISGILCHWFASQMSCCCSVTVGEACVTWTHGNDNKRGGSVKRVSGYSKRIEGEEERSKCWTGPGLEFLVSEHYLPRVCTFSRTKPLGTDSTNETQGRRV